MTADERADLRATAESIVDDAEQLKDIEVRKLELAERGANDEETKQLASKAERLAQDISHHKARAEKALANRISDSPPNE